MSIAVGCQCNEGIVLCADTQFTTPGLNKSYGCKLWRESDDSEGWSVLFAYNGLKQFMDGFKERFREALNREQERLDGIGMDRRATVPLIRDSIMTALSWLSADERHATATGAELLCAILCNSRLYLYRTHGTLVSQVSDFCSVLGETSLTKYLVPMLVKPQHGWDIGHAIFTSAYIVRCARAYMDDCGGDSDMWMISPSGIWTILTGTTMHNIDQHIGWLDYFAGEVASVLCLSAIDSGNDLDNRLAGLVGRIKDEHIELARFIPRGMKP